MKLLKRSDKIAGVPAAWKAQYCRSGEWQYGPGKKEIYEQLIAFSPLTAEDANRIIGNNSWISERCDECGRDDLETLVQLGEEPDYESATVNICQECLAKAWALIQKVVP